MGATRSSGCPERKARLNFRPSIAPGHLHYPMSDQACTLKIQASRCAYLGEVDIPRHFIWDFYVDYWVLVQLKRELRTLAVL